jgi:nucleotide-binding universal stress UspA family protein
VTAPSFHSILVGTDGSGTASAAVDHAMQLASEIGAKLVIVCAFEIAVGGESDTHKTSAVDSQWLGNPRDKALIVLESAAMKAKDAGIGTVATFARQGDPADAILDVAEEQASDLIVVGNKGMTGARRFLLGSVPNKVSHHAPCSVLIVRTT